MTSAVPVTSAASVTMGCMSALLVISCVCAVLAGLVHVYIFFLESVAWTSARVRKIFGIASDAEARATRSLAFNQGFYNLFLAIGAVLGVVFVATGDGKAEAVARSVAGGDVAETPAAGPRGLESTTWYVDDAAAAYLEG